MGKVILNATVSLDGFVADPQDDPGPLFDWYENGPVAIAAGDPERVFHVSRESADYLARTWPRVGAAIIGRRLFDITDGWKGRPANGDHVFVVTHGAPTDWDHPDAPFTFVTDGLESAVRRALAFAGERDVSLTAGDLAGQALRLGLVDEIRMDVAPVILGSGKRFFGDYDGSSLLLEEIESVLGDRVQHLGYRVVH
jgi:dihydrofolate reductase